MDADTIGEKYQALASALDERSRRLWAATEAKSLGRGGISLVAMATGVSRSTIRRGLRELERGRRLEPGRIRAPGGGRKRRTDHDPTLRADLQGLVEPSVSGDPQSSLRWTSKSVRRLAQELRSMGHTVSHTVVAELLHEAGYSLQGNRKAKEGRSHPDRNAQFKYLNRRVHSQHVPPAAR